MLLPRACTDYEIGRTTASHGCVGFLPWHNRVAMYWLCEGRLESRSKRKPQRMWRRANPLLARDAAARFGHGAAKPDVWHHHTDDKHATRVVTRSTFQIARAIPPVRDCLSAWRLERSAFGLYLHLMADAPASPLRRESIQHAGSAIELILFEHSHKEGLWIFARNRRNSHEPLCTHQ